MERLDTKRINKYILLIAEGNDAALGKLFKYTYSNMYTIVRYYVTNKSNTEDILSLLYSTVVRYSHTFDKGRNGYNWMYTVAKNLALQDNIKSSKYVAVSPDSMALYTEGGRSPLSELMLEEGLAALTEDERELIYLFYWEGYTIREISRIKNVPVSTLYSCKDRAFRKLRKYI